VALRRERVMTLDLPKALAISQLAGATFPMDITVQVMEQNTAGRGPYFKQAQNSVEHTHNLAANLSWFI